MPQTPIRSEDHWLPWGARHFFRLLWGALLGAFHDNAFSIARAATYSFLLALFPGLLFAARWLFRGRGRMLRPLEPLLARLLPTSVLHLLGSMLAGSHRLPLHLSLTALAVALWAASSVVVSWMEGFQRAYHSPPFPLLQERLLALGLALISLLPLLAGAMLVSLGQAAEARLAITYGIHFLLLWDVLRWIIAAGMTVMLFAAIYYWGVNRTMQWRRVLPGALVATLLWLPATLLFALYATRYAEYSDLYGSLAAVVVLMIWMYLLSLASLIGAEFNRELELRRWANPSLHHLFTHQYTSRDS